MGFFSDIYNKVRSGVSSVYEGVKKTVGDFSKGFYSAPGGYKYCGPGNPLDEEYMRNNPPINAADARCRQHDIDYENFKKTGVKGKELADLVRDSDNRLVEGLQSQKDRDFGSYLSEYGIRAKKQLEDWGILKPDQFVT
jgi:hypothetical protein